ncbi:MAG: D-alanyl-D-alanine carboxypeptidase [Erysipelotrichaceae bacterium]|nr:D-alanyl-D-alanine carboxypeptidase [Erysipelotrichaceae bacterium]
MKKLSFMVILLLCLWIPFVYCEETTPSNSNQEEGTTGDSTNQSENSSTQTDVSLNLASNAKSAIMLEASTGKIIYEKNSEEKLPMASMTKMMTLLLIMENIEDGNLKWDEMITASEQAASMGGSQIFLEVGEQMSVEDMVKGICIGSGNDAAVAMAERIGGTEENFVKMMNEKASKLGLKNTHFENSCGLDSDNHYSSAHDMAIIAKELVRHEKILEYTGTYEDYLRKNTDNSFWLVNTNKLVRYYQGVDGLKTGYTSTSGYCITTTAKRNNMRLITVVMGEPSSSIRNSETTAMLDYGFNTYQIDIILSKDTVLSKEKVTLGKQEYVEIVPKEDINILNTKTGTKRNVTYEVQLDNIKAPIKADDSVGKINIIENNQTIMTIDATVKTTVEKASLFTSYYRDLVDMMKGSL